jgi:hypothetical protein
MVKWIPIATSALNNHGGAGSRMSLVYIAPYGLWERY